jgi:hypothetical protein
MLFSQAKALEELDAEFGVGDLVEDEIRNERREAYSSRDLRGLRVEHAIVSVILVHIVLSVYFISKYYVNANVSC